MMASLALPTPIAKFNFDATLIMSSEWILSLFPLFIFPPLEEDEVFCALIRKKELPIRLSARMHDWD